MKYVKSKNTGIIVLVDQNGVEDNTLFSGWLMKEGKKEAYRSGWLKNAFEEYSQKEEVSINNDALIKELRGAIKKKSEENRQHKIKIKALEAKIENSDINKKYKKADELRKHWHSQYRKMEAKYKKLKKKCNKKQEYIDKIKDKVKSIF